MCKTNLILGYNSINTILILANPIVCCFIKNKMYASVRVVFSRARIRSSNSARMNIFNFTTENIVLYTHDSV